MSFEPRVYDYMVIARRLKAKAKAKAKTKAKTKTKTKTKDITWPKGAECAGLLGLT